MDDNIDRLDLVLIDDDDLIRRSWTLVARARGHRILCTASPEEFRRSGVPKDTPVYVDLCLAPGVSGLEVARSLLCEGFKRVYMCTGMPIEKNELPVGVLGAVGKEYPL